LLLKQERLRGELEALERDYTDKTAVVREAAARSAQLDQREVELAAREAELNKVKAELAHAQRDLSFGADLEQRAAQLEERERELATYVGKAQTELQRREAVWWDKQLGREDADGQPVEVDAA